MILFVVLILYGLVGIQMYRLYRSITIYYIGTDVYRPIVIVYVGVFLLVVPLEQVLLILAHPLSDV
jgi:hypothetical protein